MTSFGRREFRVRAREPSLERSLLGLVQRRRGYFPRSGGVVFGESGSSLKFCDLMLGLPLGDIRVRGGLFLFGPFGDLGVGSLYLCLFAGQAFLHVLKMPLYVRFDVFSLGVDLRLQARQALVDIREFRVKIVVELIKLV